MRGDAACTGNPTTECGPDKCQVNTNWKASFSGEFSGGQIMV